MHRAAFLAMTLALGGCITAAGIDRPGRVSLPLLAGAAAGDLVVSGLVASQVTDFTAGAAIATALAVTALDLGIGCLVGSCTALKL